MLDQFLSTILHHNWVSKLLGYDFRVEYRPGRLNTTADALSRCDGEESLGAVSSPTFQFYDDLRREIEATADLKTLHGTIMEGKHGDQGSVTDGLIRQGGKVFIPPASPQLQAALQMAHIAGHEGIQKTLQHLRAGFSVEHDHHLVCDFFWACMMCQRNKTENLQPACLLQPLPVPSRVWADISMDFVEALPKVHDKSVILTVVVRFSKYTHFISLRHPYTMSSVARAFFMDVNRLHGFPESIVSDRDSVFMSNIWRELFKLAGVTLRMSTSFHPQTDGQSKAVNKTIAMYLCCITGDRPRAWLEWLPWAEYCYNTAFHSALRTMPYQVVYGRSPPTMLPYRPGSAQLQAVDAMLTDRDAFLNEVHTRLLQP
jgi:hypothetical protein